MISNRQAEILGELLLYGEIRLRKDGYYFEGGDRVDGRSLLGLIKRGLLQPSSYNLMPSVGHLDSPIFYDNGVTSKGKRTLKKYLDSVQYYEKLSPKNRWMRKVQKLIEEESEK